MASVATRATVSNPLTALSLQREKYGFWMHFSAYVFVNLLIASMNLLYSPGAIWFIFVLFPWGIGVAAHFVGAYYLAPLRARENELKAQVATASTAPPVP